MRLNWLLLVINKLEWRMISYAFFTFLNQQKQLYLTFLKSGEIFMNENKLTFTGHETFYCRYLWLKKGYDFLSEKK